jgi:hypothetical protein
LLATQSAGLWRRGLPLIAWEHGPARLSLLPPPVVGRRTVR